MLTVLGKLTNAGKDADKVSELFGDKQVLEFIRPLLANMDLYREIRAKSLAARGEVEKAAGSIRYRLDVIAKRLPEADRWLAAGGR